MQKYDKLVNHLIENKYSQYIYFSITFILLFIITTYFYPLKQGHDLQFHILRFDALIDAIKEGLFPIYIDSKSVDGYGYATKFFYSDFVLIPFAYIAQYIGTIPAYKVMISCYTILCGIISYISVYKVFNNRYIAFIFCILYTFSYYRLYDVYNRAALGETICLTFIPLVIWGGYEIVKGNYKKWYVLTIAFTLMIYSHVNTPVIVAFIFSIFLLINSKILIKEPIRLLYLAIAAIVTIFLSSYYTFPLIEQMSSNDFYYSLTGERAISFNVMFGEPIKYVIRGLFTGATYVVPEIAGIGIVITICVLSRLYIPKDSLVKRADIFLTVGIICLFIISPFYPWRVFPFSLIGFIQFSWRFYSVATLVLCVAGSIYFYASLRKDKRRYMAGIPFLLILNIVVISNSGQVFSNNFPDYEGYSTLSENKYSLMGAEYMPSKIPNVDVFFAKRGNDSIRTIENNTQISNFKSQLRVLSFDTKTKKQDNLELPLVYYKGYKAEINDKEIEVNQSENGLIEIPVEESGNVKVYFGGTFIQKTSPYLTLLMTILLIGYIIWFNRKEKKDAK